MTSNARIEGGGGSVADDPSLLASISRREADAQAALAALYDRYASSTMALLQRIVQSRARAEELLQDVFLQVWRRAPDYAAGRGSVTAWLFTIARNRALDVVRSV